MLSHRPKLYLVAIMPNTIDDSVSINMMNEYAAKWYPRVDNDRNAFFLFAFLPVFFLTDFTPFSCLPSQP